MAATPPPGRRREVKPPAAPVALDDGESQSTNADGDYEVGYRKPPKEHRFKVGDNRKRGPKRGTRNNQTILREILEEKIVVRENGRSRKLKKIEVLFAGVVVDAIKGNARARTLIFSMLPPQQLEQMADEANVDISAVDEAILTSYFKRAGDQ